MLFLYLIRSSGGSDSSGLGCTGDKREVQESLFVKTATVTIKTPPVETYGSFVLVSR